MKCFLEIFWLKKKIKIDIIGFVGKNDNKKILLLVGCNKSRLEGKIYNFKCIFFLENRKY